jgi:transcriptional regulator with XRE-family HTH domain
MTVRNDDSIGERIRTARHDKGWTQDALADAIGVSRSAVAQWETDRTGQGTGHLIRIASVLEIGLEWLIDGIGRNGPAIAADEETLMIRLYRECSPEDQRIIFEIARRLSRAERDGAGRTCGSPARTGRLPQRARSS